MNALYKSSRWVSYSKYFAAPLLSGFLIYTLYSLWTKSQFTNGARSLDLAMLCWMGTTVPLFCVFILKNLEVTAEHILIKEIGGKKILRYEDIEWVSEQRLMRYFNVFLKYVDKSTGKSKYLFMIPETHFRADLSAMVRDPLGENEVVTFIRKRMTELKPPYWKHVGPSRFLVFGVLLLSFVPFLFVYLFLKK